MAVKNNDGKSGEPAPEGRPAAAVKPSRQAATADKRADRETRLAEALRANLRRRKANKKEQA